jgi:hypothetical protein
MAFGRGRQFEPLLVHLASYFKGRNGLVGQVCLKVVEPRWSTPPVGSSQRPQERREAIARPRLVRVEVIILPAAS